MTPMQVRRTPLESEAILWDGENITDVMDFLEKNEPNITAFRFNGEWMFYHQIKQSFLDFPVGYLVAQDYGIAGIPASHFEKYFEVLT